MGERLHHQKQAQAKARSNAYHLFSALFLHGVTRDTLPFVRSIDELAHGSGALHHRPAEDSIPGPGAIDLDAAGADHYRLFGYNVFPYESVFLDDQCLQGGTIAERVVVFYRLLGYDPDFTSEFPDHIGVEMRALAFLCGAEADAWQDGRSDQIDLMADLQLRFLDEHLLRWILPFAGAVAAQGYPLYTSLVNLAKSLAYDHRAGLGENSSVQPSDFLLPAAPKLLDDPDTGIREIAEYLIVPAYCGGFLSRDDLTRIARSLRIPHGFGSRKQIMENLLRAAIDYDQMDPLLSILGRHLSRWSAGYQIREVDSATVAHIAETWQLRVKSTQHLLGQLSQALEPIKPA